LVPNSAPKWRLIDVFDQWDCEMVHELNIIIISIFIHLIFILFKDTFGNHLLENSIRYGRLLKKHGGGNIASILGADGKLAFGEVQIKDDNKDKLNEGEWIEYFELFVFNEKF
jgi:hypothetical protein